MPTKQETRVNIQKAIKGLHMCIESCFDRMYETDYESAFQGLPQASPEIPAHRRIIYRKNYKIVQKHQKQIDFLESVEASLL